MGVVPCVQGGHGPHHPDRDGHRMGCQQHHLRHHRLRLGRFRRYLRSSDAVQPLLEAYQQARCHCRHGGRCRYGLPLEAGEKITALIPIKDLGKEEYLFMATKKGIVKKTLISEYDHIRKTGIISISLKEDDELIEVKLTNNEKDIFLVTKNGKCIRFNENDVRPTGRTSMGVIGMTLDADDEIVGMQLNTQGDSLLIASENGMGKRTALDEFKKQFYAPCSKNVIVKVTPK